MAGTGFYTSKGFSVNVSGEKSFIAKMKLEEITVKNPQNGANMTFDPEVIDFSSFDLLFGISFHF